MIEPGRDWPTVNAWRRAKRAELLSRRLDMTADQRARAREAVIDGIRELIPDVRGSSTGFYWPFKGEVDLRGFLASGADPAPPVVVRKREPVEFWAWHPDMELRRGIWDIPIPAERTVVQPSVLLIPLLGFDAAGYRLGYGGGYYDRTLGAMSTKPLAVGIGYEIGRIETIHPQPHDIPMDAIVTEAGARWVGDQPVEGGSRGGLNSDEST